MKVNKKYSRYILFFFYSFFKVFVFVGFLAIATALPNPVRIATALPNPETIATALPNPVTIDIGFTIATALPNPETIATALPNPETRASSCGMY